VLAEPPPVVWILHRDPEEREARAITTRQLGVIAVPIASASGALKSLDHGGGLIPDLILFDEAGEDMAPARFAAALTDALGDLAPPVVYIVRSDEIAAALTSLPLRMGQDVVLRPPVHHHDVCGAILSLLRRSPGEDAVLRAGSLELHIARRTLEYGDRNIHLTRLECAFIEYLMRHRGRVAGKDELLEHVWGFEPGTGSCEVLRAHVRNLRRKLELLKAPRDLIWTLPARGYQLREAPGSPPPGVIDPFPSAVA
jgi:DNA-binding response OmpR family regulator